MSTKLIAADASAGAILDPSVGDGALVIQTGAAGAKVDALTLGTTGNGALLGTLTQAGVATPRMVLATAQNTTSGTSIDFTGIPSWVKRVTFLLSGVSTNGASALQLQVGSGSVVNTGYVGYANYFTTNVVVGGQFSTGLDIIAATAAAGTVSGRATFSLLGSNIWIGDSLCSGDASNAANFIASCKIALGGSLDRIRLTTANGTDTFDAGSVNILYEG